MVEDVPSGDYTIPLGKARTLQQGSDITLVGWGAQVHVLQQAARQAAALVRPVSCEVIDLRTDDTDNVRAQKNAEDTLVKYPDISMLVGLYNYNGPAILNAVRAAGQTGKVKIVCFDENAETLDGVASGDIYGTVVQQPFEFGKQSITKMAKYLGGDKAALAGGKQIVATRSLRKDDIAAFKADLAKILGK